MSSPNKKKSYKHLYCFRSVGWVYRSQCAMKVFSFELVEISFFRHSFRHSRCRRSCGRHRHRPIRYIIITRSLRSIRPVHHSSQRERARERKIEISDMCILFAIYLWKKSVCMSQVGTFESAHKRSHVKRMASETATSAKKKERKFARK